MTQQRFLFDELSLGNFGFFGQCDAEDVTEFIPLVLHFHVNNLQSDDWTDETEVHAVNAILKRFPRVSGHLEYFSCDVSEVLSSLQDELRLKEKIESDDVREGSLAMTLADRICAEFEKGDHKRRLRIFMSELSNLILLSKSAATCAPTNGVPFRCMPSELFATDAFLDHFRFMLLACVRRAPLLFDIPDVARALLYAPEQYGASLFRSLVANNPSHLHQVLTAVLRTPRVPEARIRDFVLAISQLSPSYVPRTVRSLCSRERTMPQLCIELTSTFLRDEVDFLLSEIGSGSWLWTHLVRGTPSEHVKALRASLCSALQSKCNGNYTRLSSLVRIHAALIQPPLANGGVGSSSGIFGATEIRSLLRVITDDKCPEDVVKMCFGLLLMAPKLLDVVSAEFLLSTFRPLLHIVPTKAHSGAEPILSKLPAHDVLLLLATYFHTKSFREIGDFARSALGLPHIQIGTETMQKVGQFFTNGLLPVELLGKLVLETEPKSVSASSDWFALTCVYHFASGGLFRSIGVDPSPWIARLVECAGDPVHPLLISLMDSLIQGSTPQVPSATTSASSLPSPFSLLPAPLLQRILLDAPQLSLAAKSPLPSSVLGVKRKRSEETAATNVMKSEAPGLVSLYYVLKVESTPALAGSYQGIIPPSKMKQILEHSQTATSITHTLSNHKRVGRAKSHRTMGREFDSPLDAKLLGMLVTLFPAAYVPSLTAMGDSEVAVGDGGRKGGVWSVEYDVAKELFETQTLDRARIRKVLCALKDLAPQELSPYQDMLISVLLPKLLPSPPRDGGPLDSHLDVLSEYAGVWTKRLVEDPFDVSQSTMRSFGVDIPPPDTAFVDPLLLFTCSPSVFASPVLFAMFLQILACYLGATKRLLSDPSADTSKEQVGALLLSQDSAAVQMLFELCLDSNSSPCLPSIRSQVCEFVHQMFIDNPLLAKAVHFQGYPSELLQMTVTGIESMHVCLDFLPELLGHPDPQQQAFAVHLATWLLLKYPMHRTLPLARLVVARVRSWLPSHKHSRILPSVFPSLAQLCKAMPFLSDEVVHVLHDATRFSLAVAQAAKEVVASLPLFLPQHA